MSATATLRVERKRGMAVVTVDCFASTTAMTFIAGGELDLSEAQIVTVTAMSHEERCGRCDLAGVFARGDGALREQTERAWAELLLAGRRN